MVISLVGGNFRVNRGNFHNADASAWHYGSFPKAVRGYWHDNISKNKMAAQYHYTKKYQNVDLYTKDNGKWFHGVMNRINTYNGSLRYKIIGTISTTLKQQRRKTISGILVRTA